MKHHWLSLALLLGASRASADDASWKMPEASSSAWFVAGGLAAFLGHESGHLIANYSMGNSPHFKRIWVAGFIPFLDIEPGIACNAERCFKRNGQVFEAGRRGKFEIVSAGFHVQHVTDEILLRLRPNLRHESAPFLKGVLAFNTLVSVMYAVGAWTQLEPEDAGDIAGQARLSGIPRPLLAGALLLPAALDLYRYYRPSSWWAPWAALAAKAGYVGLVFTF